MLFKRETWGDFLINLKRGFRCSRSFYKILEVIGYFQGWELTRGCYGIGGGEVVRGETLQRRKAKAPWLVQQTTMVNFTYFIFKFNLSFSHLTSIKWDKLCI